METTAPLRTVRQATFAPEHPAVPVAPAVGVTGVDVDSLQSHPQIADDGIITKRARPD
jgi:hypothetical protein